MAFTSSLARSVMPPRSSLRSKSSRNLGSMAKIFLHSLSILKKQMIEFLGLKFGRFCGSMTLMVSCYVSFRVILSCRPEVCILVNGKQSKPFHVGVELRQGCVLSPLLFIVYINWIDICTVMGTVALFTSGATFSVAVAAALLLFFVTSDKRQRRCSFSRKSGIASAVFF